MPPILREHRETFPVPVLDDRGRPTGWQPTGVTRAPWGSLRLFVNDVDVSLFRGVPVLWESISWADPFGPERASWTFPQITSYEQLGVGDLAWITGHYDNVRVEHWDENDLPVVGGGWPWFGLFVEDDDELTETSNSLKCSAIGSLYQLSLYLKKPENTDQPVDIGQLLFKALWPRLHKAYRFELENGDDLADPAIDAPVLGVTSGYRGNFEGLDEYCRKLLELVPDFTIDLDETNTAKIVARNTDLAVVDWTVRTGQPGVTHHLVRSSLLSPNAIQAQGIDPSGITWRNLFPFDDGSAYGTVFYQPVAYDPEVNPYDETITGELDFVPGRLVEAKIKHESFMDFGQGVGIPEAKAIAEGFRLRWETPGRLGTVTLSADPNEGSRLGVRQNQVLRLQNYRGGNLDLFIARAELRFSSDRVDNVLTVDSQARTALLVDAVMEGLRQRVRNPVPQLLIGQRRANEESAFRWDPHSGYIPNDDVVGRRWVSTAARVHCLPDQWTIYRFLASERDSIISTRLDTDPAVKFHASIYNLEPDPLDLPIDPFAEGAWDPLPEGYVIGWGQFEQGAGYSPGSESAGDPVTGVLDDDGTWQYTHDDIDPAIGQPAFLWVAVFPAADTYFGGRLVRGVGTQL